MRFPYMITFGALLTIATLAPAFGATIPESVKEVVRNRVDNGQASMVIALVDADGVDYFAYGKTALDGGTTPDENTVYEIGSITKVFTAILLVDMKNRGEVALDDPIGKYLPEGAKSPQRDGKSITLERLSEQTSGLPRMPTNFRPKDPGNPFADYTPEQLYAFLSGYELKRGIGERFEYSNVGVGLLGNLLERASGKSYEQLTVERIADVLGMPDTRVVFTEGMTQRLAPGYIGTNRSQNWDLPTLAGAGALRSTAKDMVTFIQANLGLVETPLRAAMDETHRPRVDAGAPNMRIGLGWFTLKGEKGPAVIWHNGGTGGYRTFAGFAPETRTGAIVLCNSGGEGHDDIGFYLLNDSLPMKNTVKRTEITLAEPVLKSYEGKYQLGPGTILRVDLRGGNLFAQLATQPAFRIYPEAETEFFLKDVDAQISFKKDVDGKVTELVLHQNGRNMPAKRIE